MSDTTRSPEEIESVANRRRSEVRETIEKIRYQFSPEAVSESIADYIRGPGGRRIIAAVRENPVAAVLASAGICWLLYTARQHEHRSSMTRGGTRQGDPSRPGVMGDGTQEQSLGQVGNPDARTTEEEITDAFQARPVAPS